MVVSCKAVWKLGQIRVEDRKKNHDLAHFRFVALRPDRGLAPSLALERDVGGGGPEGHDDPPSLVATRHPILQVLVAHSEYGASASGLGGSLRITLR